MGMIMRLPTARRPFFPLGRMFEDRKGVRNLIVYRRRVREDVMRDAGGSGGWARFGGDGAGRGAAGGGEVARGAGEPSV